MPMRLAFTLSALLPTVLLAAPDAEALLASLRANDAAFENALIEFETRSSVERHESLGEYTTLTAPTGEMLATHYVETIIARGKEITHEKRAHEDMTPWWPGGKGAVAAYYKTTNCGGTRRSYQETRYPGGAEPSRMLDVEAIDPKRDFSENALIECQFPLGIGYGSRIAAVDEVSATPDGQTRLKGRIRMGGEQEMTCDLMIDSAYLVRTAHIEGGSGSIRTTVEVQTSGTRLEGGHVIAETGSFKKNINIPTDFTIQFTHARFDIGDGEYRKLTEVQAPDGAYVWDHLSDTQGVKGQKPILPQTPSL